MPGCRLPQNRRLGYRTAGDVPRRRAGCATSSRRPEALLQERKGPALRRVAALSVPVLVLGFWALRGLAPTQLKLAGVAVGLTAGGLGAFGYALHCPEVSPVFVLNWYTLEILVPAAAGAVLGPRLLRW